MKQSEQTLTIVETNIPFEGHNSLRFFEGEIISLSEGSAVLKIESVDLTVGEKIKLQLSHHFPGYEACILECSVTEKVVKKNQSWAHYHIKYTSFNQNFWQQISNTFSSRAA